MTRITENKTDKRPLIDRIFPPRYDFEGMLVEQAKITSIGVRELVDWLKRGATEEPKELATLEQRADDVRHDLEHRLQEAFSTPFDRQDIYTISRQMDQVLNFSLSTAVEMRAFEVAPSQGIIGMAEALCKGALLLPEDIEMMRTKNRQAQDLIRRIREHMHEVENAYIQSMTLLFSQSDAITALKNREIYHHLRDAGRNLSSTIDILHRIIVEIA